MYMYIVKSIPSFVKEGEISCSILLNQSFISFGLQIGATDILVSPSFDCRS